VEKTVCVERHDGLTAVEEPAGTPLGRLAAEHPALMRTVRRRLVDEARKTTSVTPFSSVMG
jgi:hypothetical protein